MTNALRFGVPDPTPGRADAAAHVRVRLQLLQGAGASPSLLILVEDNGPGLSREAEADHPDALGLKLVRALARQLRATLELQSGEGCRAVLDIPLERALLEDVATP